MENLKTLKNCLDHSKTPRFMSKPFCELLHPSFTFVPKALSFQYNSPCPLLDCGPWGYAHHGVLTFLSPPAWHTIFPRQALMMVVLVDRWGPADLPSWCDLTSGLLTLPHQRLGDILSRVGRCPLYSLVMGTCLGAHP